MKFIHFFFNFEFIYFCNVGHEIGKLVVARGPRQYCEIWEILDTTKIILMPFFFRYKIMSIEI